MLKVRSSRLSSAFAAFSPVYVDDVIDAVAWQDVSRRSDICSQSNLVALHCSIVRWLPTTFRLGFKKAFITSFVKKADLMSVQILNLTVASWTHVPTLQYAFRFVILRVLSEATILRQLNGILQPWPPTTTAAARIQRNVSLWFATLVVACADYSRFLIRHRE